MSSCKEKDMARDILRDIKKLGIKKEVRIMEVCGTHTQTIARYGIKNILPENIKLISGPGCPVCVTPASHVDLAIKLAEEEDVIITTYGDAYKLPGSEKSLAEVGKNVKIVYSVDEVIEMCRAQRDKEFVHLSIGFETTAPAIASVLLKNPELENFSIIPSNKLIPPAMQYLIKNDCKIDGFICPGHVSAIIGAKPYERIAEVYEKPCVISGFEAIDVLKSILMILNQIKNNISKVEIEYKRLVKYEGNKIAREKMDKVFKASNAYWRGIGNIPSSGLKLRNRFKRFDAPKRYKIKLKDAKEIKPGCLCSKIIVGNALPTQCKLFRKECTPYKPYGPCMVSVEGACNVAFRYG